MSALAKLSATDARELTNQVKADAEALWAKLLELYERGAHESLGYASWASYAEAEFGHSKDQAYRLLRAARTVDELPIGNSRPANEAQARELAPLRDEPQKMAAAWEEASANGTPTAEKVRAAVDERLPAKAERKPYIPEPAPEQESDFAHYLSRALSLPIRCVEQIDAGHTEDVDRLDYDGRAQLLQRIGKAQDALERIRKLVSGEVE